MFWAVFEYVFIYLWCEQQVFWNFNQEIVFWCWFFRNTWDHQFEICFESSDICCLSGIHWIFYLSSWFVNKSSSVIDHLNIRFINHDELKSIVWCEINSNSAFICHCCNDIFSKALFDCDELSARHIMQWLWIIQFFEWQGWVLKQVWFLSWCLRWMLDLWSSALFLRVTWWVFRQSWLIVLWNFFFLIWNSWGWKTICIFHVPSLDFSDRVFHDKLSSINPDCCPFHSFQKSKFSFNGCEFWRCFNLCESWNCFKSCPVSRWETTINSDLNISGWSWWSRKIVCLCLDLIKLLFLKCCESTTSWWNWWIQIVQSCIIGKKWICRNRIKHSSIPLNICSDCCNQCNLINVLISYCSHNSIEDCLTITIIQDCLLNSNCNCWSFRWCEWIPCFVLNQFCNCMKISRGEHELISFCLDCCNSWIVWCCICESCHSGWNSNIKSCKFCCKLNSDCSRNIISCDFFCHIDFIISNQRISDWCTSINWHLVLITSSSCVWIPIIVWTRLNWWSKLSHGSWRHNNFSHVLNADCWCESRCWKWNDYHNVMNSSWLRYIVLLQ